MGCLYILCIVSIQLAVASYYEPSQLHQLAAFYNMYDIDMPESLEMQLAAAMSGINQGYNQQSRSPFQNQPTQQQYYQPKPTTPSRYNRQPVPQYPNNQQYQNPNNLPYRNENNQQYRNTNNQQYRNTNNQQYRNTNYHQYRSNQQYRNTNNQQYRNTNNQQYRNQKSQQYQKPNSQYPRSRQQSAELQRRGDAAVTIPTTTQIVQQFETSTPIPNIDRQTTPGTLPAVGSVQAKVAQNNNQTPSQRANHQRQKTYQTLSAQYHWPNSRQNYQNAYQQRTTAPYNYYPRSNNYQTTNQNYYRGASNPRPTSNSRYQNNYQQTNQNNYQSQNYNRYHQSNAGYPTTNFLPYMAATDVFDIY